MDLTFRTNSAPFAGTGVQKVRIVHVLQYFLAAGFQKTLRARPRPSPYENQCEMGFLRPFVHFRAAAGGGRRRAGDPHAAGPLAAHLGARRRKSTKKTHLALVFIGAAARGRAESLKKR